MTSACRESGPFVERVVGMELTLWPTSDFSASQRSSVQRASHLTRKRDQVERASVRILTSSAPMAPAAMRSIQVLPLK